MAAQPTVVNPGSDRKPAAPRTQRPAHPSAVRTFTFDDDAISGANENPVGEFIQTSAPSQHASLIDLCTTLIPEIAKSLEDL